MASGPDVPTGGAYQLADGVAPRLEGRNMPKSSVVALSCRLIAAVADVATIAYVIVHLAS